METPLEIVNITFAFPSPWLVAFCGTVSQRKTVPQIG